MEAILDGRQPEEVTLPALTRPFSVEWDEQLVERAMGDLPGRSEVFEGAIATRPADDPKTFKATSRR